MKKNYIFLRYALLWLCIVQPHLHAMQPQNVQQQKMMPSLVSQKAAITPPIPAQIKKECEDLPHLDKEKAIQQYKLDIKNGIPENQKIPKKDASILRIMSYNVHYWANPEEKNLLSLQPIEDIFSVIEKINPDIAILQEVVPGKYGWGGIKENGGNFVDSLIMNKLKEKGFVHFSFCNTLAHQKSSQWFGNVIASKVPLLNCKTAYFSHQNHPYEKRCYVSCSVQIPTIGELYMYGTHLEVADSKNAQGDASYDRLQQLTEIYKEIQNNLKNKNVLIAADFNTRRGCSPIKFLQQNGFKDSFSYLGWNYPFFTNWTGSEIDFIFLSPAWNLPLAGSYAYYDEASDHLPIIIDIKVSGTVTKPQQSAQAPIQKPQLSDTLIQAVKSQNLASVDALLKQGANPTAIGSVQESALHYAILYDQTGTIVQRLLSIPGIDVNIKNTNFRQTPLYLTVDNPAKGLEYARMLIAKGARVNELTNKNATALHAAARKGRLDIAALLLNSGIEVSVHDNSGTTAHDYAVAAKQSQIAELIKNWAIQHKKGF